MSESLTSKQGLNKWPERIYLQRDYECAEEGCGPHSGDDGETTWCKDKIHDTDVEYVRADLARVSDEPAETHPMLTVLTICDAYESGMGQGLARREFRNPYDPVNDPHAYRAYGHGYDEGVKRRAAEPPSAWQPIETAPHDREVLFWVVPLSADETYRDTSGNPITSGEKPRMMFCRFGRWSSLSKAIYWADVPGSPTVTKSEEPEPEHVCDGGWACHFHDVKKAADEKGAVNSADHNQRLGSPECWCGHRKASHDEAGCCGICSCVKFGASDSGTACL